MLFFRFVISAFFLLIMIYFFKVLVALLSKKLHNVCFAANSQLFGSERIIWTFCFWLRNEDVAFFALKWNDDLLWWGIEAKPYEFFVSLSRDRLIWIEIDKCLSFGLCFSHQTSYDYKNVVFFLSLFSLKFRSSFRCVKKSTKDEFDWIVHIETWSMFLN